MAVKKERVVKKKKLKVEKTPRQLKDVLLPVTFVIEGAGLSINHMYARFKGRVFLKPAGKDFKLNGAIHLCNQLGFDYSVNDKTKEITVIHGIAEQKYKVVYKVYGRWLTKKGDILKSDASNRLKLVEDALSEAIGVDDKYFWDTQIIKIHSVEEKFEITLDLL